MGDLRELEKNLGGRLAKAKTALWRLTGKY
jgi:hypothetical protein